MATNARDSRPKADFSPDLKENNEGASKGPKPLILFVHGIRDPGFWTRDLCQLFEEHGFVAKAIGYGVFDAFRFLLGFRRRPVATVKQQILNAIAESAVPGAEVTIIAHSFGTYIVSRILDDDPNIKIARLVMCGGIVPQTFRWDKLARFNVQKLRPKLQIINEHSARDVWPILARHATYGFGDSGTTGCANMIDVQNRRHDMPHSGYLKLDFARSYWIPPIVHGHGLKYPKVPPRNPWYFFLTKSPVRLISAAIIGIATYAGVDAADRAWYRTAGSYESPKKENINFEIAGFGATYNQWPEYMYSAPHFDSPFKKRIFSDSQFNRVVVKVLNRPLFQCENEKASASAGSRTPLEGSVAVDSDGAMSEIIAIASALRRGYMKHKDAIKLLSGITANEAKKYVAETKHTFDFSNAYRSFGLSQMEFEYRLDSWIGNQAADKLILRTGGRLISDQIVLVSVEHDEKERCLNIEVNGGWSHFVDKQSLPAETGGWLAWFIGKVWADDAKQSITQTDIKELLASPDPASRAIAAQSIAASPQAYADTVRKIIADPASSPETVADAIWASRNALPSPILLDADALINLAHAGPPVVRDAARSYLRARGVVSREIASKFTGEEFEKKVETLRTAMVNGSERRYFQDYLLLITARDVFYNLGLSELAPYLENIRKGEPASLAGVLAPFDTGMKLSKLTDVYEEKVALAKNGYGKALAMFESAVNLEAAAKAGTKNVFKYIEDQKPGAKLLDDKRAAQKIVDQFNVFLAEVKGREDLYPWPVHVAQAKRCANKLTFACLNSAAGETQ